MSKKTLLNESQIRSFMKLAKLEPLTPGFVEGLTESTDDLDEGRGKKMRDEDELEERMGGAMMRDEDELDEMRGDKDEMDEVRADAAGGGLQDARRGHGRGRGPADRLEEEAEDMAVDAMDDAGDEMEMDAELEAPAADAGKMVSVDDFLSALERALEDAMGEEVEIDADEVADDEPADALDAADDEPADDMMEAKHEDDEKLEEGEHADKEEKVDEALMESITKRVAKRILMEALNVKK
jgi:hypothetical protein